MAIANTIKFFSFLFVNLLAQYNFIILPTDQLSIRVTPTNVVIGEGGTAQFTAIGSGVNMGRFMYQWRRKGSRLLNKVSGVNGAVLTIPNLVKSDEGEYYCTVTNEWGNSERSGDVTLSIQGMLGLYCEGYGIKL